MRSLRSENKGTTRQPVLVRWVDIGVRSVGKCDGTRRIEGAESIDRTWPTTTLGGDVGDRVAMSASVHRTGEWWMRASGNSGALSKPQAGCGVIGSSRSATRPSIATSGAIESEVAASTNIYAVRPNNAENGTGPTIPVVGWPANGPLVNDPLVRGIEAESVTSKPIP